MHSKKSLKKPVSSKTVDLKSRKLKLDDDANDFSDLKHVLSVKKQKELEN